MPKLSPDAFGNPKSKTCRWCGTEKVLVWRGKFETCEIKPCPSNAWLCRNCDMPISMIKENE